MYIFEKTPGKFIFGKSVNSSCSSGKFGIDPSADGTKVTIYFIGNGIPYITDKPISTFKKEDGSSYANFGELYLATKSFFDTIPATAENQNDLLGRVSQIVTGVAKTAIKAGYYAYGCTCRVDGSKIASLEKTVGTAVSADNDESITGIAMFQGEYQPFVNKVTSVTQTAATDSITYWLKPF